MPHSSPPTVSLASPSTVSATTLKYLEPFLQERKHMTQSQVPGKSRKQFPPNTTCYAYKESLHVCDGDSCEITLSPDNRDTDLANLATHSNTIRIRMPHSDSPETANATCIYKQSQKSTHLSTFLTRHIGIECLRAAQQMVTLELIDEYREILNTPMDPNLAWIPTQSSALLDGGDEDGSVPNSETTDNFYLRMVPSQLYWESRCSVAQSTITGTGSGLFVQPLEGNMPVGEHMCIYAERSTTIDEITASGSSH
ncbi:Hypothetical predicted protein, partial [Paramuricea clavata]